MENLSAVLKVLMMQFSCLWLCLHTVTVWMQPHSVLSVTEALKTLMDVPLTYSQTASTHVSASSLKTWKNNSVSVIGAVPRQPISIEILLTWRPNTAVKLSVAVCENTTLYTCEWCYDVEFSNVCGTSTAVTEQPRCVYGPQFMTGRNRPLLLWTGTWHVTCQFGCTYLLLQS